MRGRSSPIRDQVYRLMAARNSEALTIKEICNLLGLKHSDNMTVNRALNKLGARPIGTTKPRPVPGRRGGCKPSYLWRLP